MARRTGGLPRILETTNDPDTDCRALASLGRFFVLQLESETLPTCAGSKAKY
jgi:hypothetical protein